MAPTTQGIAAAFASRHSTPIPTFCGDLTRLRILILLALAILAASALRSADEGVPPPPLPDLPDPVPDIVALVKAEKPVGLVKWAEDKGRQEVEAICARSQQGDQDEALRLYQQFADAHPGTPAAAEALHEVSIHLVFGKETELRQLGDLALHMAKEVPREPLTVTVLDRYVRSWLEARTRVESKRVGDGKYTYTASPDRVEPKPDDWNRIVLVAAIMTGRYPDDTRGMARLIEIARALHPSPRGKARALELIKFLSETEWLSAWDTRFEAFKALHDEELANGNREAAEKLAIAAITICGGRISVPVEWEPEAKVVRELPDTPWQKALSRGIPSTARVLLAEPAWETGAFFTIQSRAERNRDVNEWEPLLDNNAAKDIHVCISCKSAEGRILAGVTDRFYYPPCSHRSCAGHFGEGAAMGYLGTWRRGAASELSLLFLPQFPVREGVEIIPYGKTLARQEAKLVGESVQVTLRAGKTVWVQHWRPGQTWYDRASVEARIASLGDRTWSVNWRAAFERVPAKAENAEATEREVLDSLRSEIMTEESWCMDGDGCRMDDGMTKLVWSRIEKLFDAEKQKGLRSQWFPQPFEDGWAGWKEQERKRREEVQALRGKPPAAARETFQRYSLRFFWPQPEDRNAQQVRVERKGGVARLLVADGNTWSWCLGSKGEQLELPKDLGPVPPSRDDDGYGTARIPIGERQELTYLREADRIVAIDATGKEQWRHAVPGVRDTKSRREPGLTLLADPQLVASVEGERIVCGIGQRQVFITMGISYEPDGGGLLALGLDGRKIWENDVGYCSAIAAFPLGDRTAIAGSFVIPGKGADRYKREHELPRFIAAFDAATGKEIWRQNTDVEARGDGLFPFKAPAQNGIVASWGKVVIFSAEGKRLSESEDGSLKVVAVADIDGDGRDEIVACKSAYAYDGTGPIQILDLDGKPLWTAPGAAKWRVCACEDLDGDGWKELVVVGGGVGVFGLVNEQ